MPRFFRAPLIRRARRVLGELARERGRASEARVLRACRRKDRPDWMRAARAATSEEDRHGIDVVVESDVGKLYVQVKSSAVGKVAFQDRRPRARIAVVVVRSRDSNEDLLRQIVGELSRLRAVFLAKREPSR